jgi:hypothetical protein
VQGTEAELGRDTIRIRLSEPKWVNALLLAGGAALMFAGLVVPAAETLPPRDCDSFIWIPSMASDKL